MSKLITYIFFTAILLAIYSCKKPPNWPDTPIINQIDDTKFIKSVTGFDLDTIRLHISFQDGDGNIGIEPDIDTVPEFMEYEILKDNSGNPIYYVDSTDKFDFYNFAIDEIDNDPSIDTFRIKKNLFANNILFNFIRYNPLGQVIDTIDVERLGELGFYDDLNGQIEPLNKKDYTDDVYEGPIEGDIYYNITSTFLNLPKGTYKISVRLVDRDFNVSNELVTEPKITIK